MGLPRRASKWYIYGCQVDVRPPRKIPTPSLTTPQRNKQEDNSCQCVKNATRVLAYNKSLFPNEPQWDFHVALPVDDHTQNPVDLGLTFAFEQEEEEG